MPGGLLLLIGLLWMAWGLVALAESAAGRQVWQLLNSADDASEHERVGASDVGPADWPAGPVGSSAANRDGRNQAPKPIGIRIPTLEVDAEMIALGLRDDGSIEVPTDFSQTGWWVDGPEPGEAGPAVVLGHVDSQSGPAVFYSLTDLRPGDEVIIDRIDGSSVAYRVDRIEQHAKEEFPTQAVYGDTPDAQLRLVTCGGDFDRSERSYRDNVVVFASLV